MIWALVRRGAGVSLASSPVFVEAEFDVAQAAVADLWRLELAGDAPLFSVRVVENEFDRVQPVGDATGGSAAAAHQLDQLAAQGAVDAFLKADADVAALVACEAKPVVPTDGDVHAGAHKLAVAVGAGPARASLDALLKFLRRWIERHAMSLIGVFEWWRRASNLRVC